MMFKKTPVQNKDNMKRVFRLSSAVLASTFFVHSLYGATQITTVDNTNHQTSVDGDIEITPSGQINVASGDGITVNSASATITVDANNSNGTCGFSNNFTNCAIVAKAGNGINLPNGGNGTTATINIGANSTVFGSDTAGIYIQSTGAKVTNSGTIGSDTIALDIDSGGTSATITNAKGGVILNTANIAVINVNETGASITNAGTIKPRAVLHQTGADAIKIQKDFTTVTNQAGGVIDGDAASAINIAGAVTGDIQNSGTMKNTNLPSPNTLAAINIIGAYNGSITNNSGGVIQTSGGNGADAIFIGNAFTSINNMSGGTIQALSAGDYAITVGAASSGTINNAGTIQSNTKAAILLDFSGTLGGITNSGTIKSTNLSAGTGVIVVSGSGAMTFTNGIVNSGNITDVAGNASAINLQANGQNNNIPLFQNGGTITGDVYLSPAGGTVLTMTGGTIDGDIVAGTTNANTLKLNGGTVTGTITLGDEGDTFYLGGSDVQTVNVAGPYAGNTTTFNLSGGSFVEIDGASSLTDIMNVNNSFTDTGTISHILALNVNNSGTVFTVKSNQFSDVKNINIDTGATLSAQADITLNAAGTTAITNDGTITLYSPYVLVADNYQQNSGGNFAIQIPEDSKTVGQIQATQNALLLADSYISPFLISGDFYTAGTTYNILTAPTGSLADSSSIKQPPSAVLSFTKDTITGPNSTNCAFGQDCIQLTLDRATYQSVALTPNTVAVASVLDALLPTTTDPEFIALFAQLDFLPTAQELTDALAMLLPSYNYSLIEGSHVSMDSAFDSVQQRLEDLRGLGPLWSVADFEERRDETFYNGTNYGDHMFGAGRNGAWVKLFGAGINQGTRNYVTGYNVTATGLSIGTDTHLLDSTTVGVAVSYTKTTVDNKGGIGSDDIKSYQATFYGWFHPYAPDDSLFIDTMVGVATHEYDTTRYISIGSMFETATAQFYGMHYGAQADVGYAFLSDDTYYVAPIARVKYTYLDISDYTETGAGSLDLSVHNAPLKEFVVGAGFRFALQKDYVQILYVPEFSAMYLYDFIGDQQQEVSNFLGGGSAFPTYGIEPAQASYVLSAGVNAYSNDNYIVSLKYNLELRDHFTGNTGYLKLEYRWD